MIDDLPSIEMLPSHIAHIPPSERRYTVYLLRKLQSRRWSQPFDVRACLNELLSIYCRNLSSSSESVRGNGYNYIIKAMNLIQQEPYLSMTALSERVGLNPDYLNRIFKKELHVTVMRYRIISRALAAAELLEKNELSVSDMARELGYKNVSLFCAQFRTVFKKTPAVYRSEIRYFAQKLP